MKSEFLILIEPHKDIQRKINQWQSTGYTIVIHCITPMSGFNSYAAITRTKQGFALVA